MLIADISDQLGNQMFAYASVKTIAEKKGYEFGFIRAHNSLINDNDQLYGNEIHTIFPNVKKDFLSKLPDNIKYTFSEKVTADSQKTFSKEALNVNDSTYMKGHFISYLYFSENMEHVREWFTFPKETTEICQSKINMLKEKYPDKELVAIHFRVGEDYFRQGFLLNSSYWFDAAELMLQKAGKGNVIFVPFYDYRPQSGGLVNQFIHKYPCEIIRGSLVEDMCCMTMFQNLIVCNSSFSIMAGILNSSENKTIIRPSVYPTGTFYRPTDCFPETWNVISAKRDTRSHIQYYWMLTKGHILKFISKIKKHK